MSESVAGAAPARTPRARRVAVLLFLAGLFAAGFLFRLYPVRANVFWDEAVYLQNALVICCGKGNYSELSSRPPLLSLIYAVLFLLGGQNLVPVMVAAFNALGPVFLYKAGELLVGRTAAAIAAVLLALSPFFLTIDTGNSLLTDSPALTLILLAFWLLLKGVASDKPGWLAVSGLVCGLSGLMRFTSLITLGVFPLYLWWARRKITSVALFAAGVLAALGPYLAWSQVQYGSFLATLSTARANVILEEQPALFYIQRFTVIFPWVTIAGAALWFIAAWRDRHRTNSAPVLDHVSGLLLWWWGALVLVYLSTIPHKEVRYLIPLAPAWFLLSGRGLALLLEWSRPWARRLSVAILLAVLAWTFAPGFDRFKGSFRVLAESEEQQVAAFLNAGGKSDTPLYANFNYPVFAYHTRFPIRVLHPQDDTFYNIFPQNMPDDGYVILYKFVPKQPPVGWADQDFHFKRLREFPSLVVFEYRRSGFKERR